MKGRGQGVGERDSQANNIEHNIEDAICCAAWNGWRTRCLLWPKAAWCEYNVQQKQAHGTRSRQHCLHDHARAMIRVGSSWTEVEGFSRGLSRGKLPSPETLKCAFTSLGCFSNLNPASVNSWLSGIANHCFGESNTAKQISLLTNGHVCSSTPGPTHTLPVHVELWICAAAFGQWLHDVNVVQSRSKRIVPALCQVVPLAVSHNSCWLKSHHTHGSETALRQTASEMNFQLSAVGVF